jgi:hypothetical protein
VYDEDIGPDVDTNRVSQKTSSKSNAKPLQLPRPQHHHRLKQQLVELKQVMSLLTYLKPQLQVQEVGLGLVLVLVEVRQTS